MRTIIALAIVLLVLALVGWITFSQGDGRSSINVETERIREDTQDALESGSNLLQDAERQLNDRSSQPTGTTRPVETGKTSATNDDDVEAALRTRPAGNGAGGGN
jgi:hypothetical protein